jgi:YfiH family protein
MPTNSIISFNIFNEYPGLICAFSTRKGGISKGVYRSLNLGFNSGDKRSTVEKNRHLFLRQLGINAQQIAFAGQIHSATVKWIDRPGLYPKTDALLCSLKGIFLTIQTADCFPLMIFIPDRGIVAAVHCGWRGLADGIVQRVLEECKDSMNGALAVIGPGIQKNCFEVGPDVYTKFAAKYTLKHADPKKRFLDLQRIIVDTLIEFGFSANRIQCEQTCTHCAEETFFSYRRDGDKSGRMLAVIGMV